MPGLLDVLKMYGAQPEQQPITNGLLSQLPQGKFSDMYGYQKAMNPNILDQIYSLQDLMGPIDEDTKRRLEEMRNMPNFLILP